MSHLYLLIEILNHWSALWLNRMVRDGWQGGLLILFVWLLCRCFRKIPSSARSWLWWIASLKLLLGLFPALVLSLPRLSSSPPSPFAHQPASLARTVPAPAASPRLPTAHDQQPRVFKPPPLVNPARSITPWSARYSISPAGYLLLFWILCLLLKLRRTHSSFERLRRLRADASPLEDPGLSAEVERVARRMGLRRVPRLFACPQPLSLYVAGRIRPMLFLSPDLQTDLSPQEIEAALAHELAHIRRRDLWMSLIPGLADALFFFFPLARLALREWHTAVEAACDAEAIRRSRVSVNDYGILLLKVVTLKRSFDPVTALGASDTFRVMDQRLSLLPQHFRALSRSLAVTLAAVAVLELYNAVPLQWTDGTLRWYSVPVPTLHRRGMAAAVGADGTLYFMGGYHDPLQPVASLLDAYHPDLDRWMTLPPMPNRCTSSAAVTASDGSICLFGGTGDGGAGSAWDFVQQFRPQTGEWTVDPVKMPHAIAEHVAVAAPNGWIYLIGGNYQRMRENFVAFDPASHRWSELKILEFQRARMAGVLGPDGRIYVIGGYTWKLEFQLPKGQEPHGSVLDRTEAFDPATETWETLPPMPTPRENCAAALGPDGRIYVIGGDDFTHALDTVEAYDPKTKRWTQEAPLPEPRTELSAVTGHDGRIYVYGGSERENPDEKMFVLSPTPPAGEARPWFDRATEPGPTRGPQVPGNPVLPKLGCIRSVSFRSMRLPDGSWAPGCYVDVDASKAYSFRAIAPFRDIAHAPDPDIEMDVYSVLSHHPEKLRFIYRMNQEIYRAAQKSDGKNLRSFKEWGSYERAYFLVVRHRDQPERFFIPEQIYSWDGPSYPWVTVRFHDLNRIVIGNFNIA